MIGAAIGVVIALPFAIGLWTGGPLLWIGVAIYVLFFGWQLYCRRWRRNAPEKYRELTLRFMDTRAGPPPGAEPVDEPLVQRWEAYSDGLDREKYAALLSEDFTYRSPALKRPMSRARYLRSVAASSQILQPSEGWLEGMWSDPSERDVAWVRLRARSHPKGHDEIHVARWERWTLTPDRERIRATTFVAFVPPLVTA
jgi:hypothetical protein